VAAVLLRRRLLLLSAGASVAAHWATIVAANRRTLAAAAEATVAAGAAVAGATIAAAAAKVQSTTAAASAGRHLLLPFAFFAQCLAPCLLLRLRLGQLTALGQPVAAERAARIHRHGVHVRVGRTTRGRRGSGVSATRDCDVAARLADAGRTPRRLRAAQRHEGR
jgi:hypothetical protein